jgi:hypothetical protein
LVFVVAARHETRDQDAPSYRRNFDTAITVWKTAGGGAHRSDDAPSFLWRDAKAL